LLTRQPDPGGLASWTALLNQGSSRHDITLAIEQSQEWRTDQVEALYQQFLHRAADASGLNTFVTFLSAGGTLEQVKSFLAGSAEYLQARGGGTNDGFLGALYQDALSRSPDAGGSATFTQALNRGLSRQQVAAAVFASPEYLRDFVASLYQLYLHRAADDGGLNGFVASLSLGIPDQEVISAILGSDEFFAHV